MQQLHSDAKAISVASVQSGRCPEHEAVPDWFAYVAMMAGNFGICVRTKVRQEAMQPQIAKMWPHCKVPRVPSLNVR